MSDNTIDIREAIKASPLQLRYADTLFYGALAGFVVMIVTYAVYVCGLLEPQIPLEQLPHLWTQNAATYRAAGNIPQGWGWLALAGRADIMNFVGIVILASLTILCFLQLAIGLARKKQWVMCVIALLEVLVLTLAASGLLASGGH